jgi:hypothetical protein
MRIFLAGLLVGAIACAPAAGAPTDGYGKPVTETTAATSVDAEKMALAHEVVLAFVPPGSVQKMMSGLAQVRSGMMSQMFRVTPKDVGVKDAKDGQTLGEAVRERDPHFEERMEITNRVMMEEMGKVMAGFEPELRETMARMYARRFTKTELTDLAAFLRTPSGKSFASQMFQMTSDPEYQQSITKLAPRIMQAMPGIMAKIKEATSKLPPPPSEDEKAKPAELPSS